MRLAKRKVFDVALSFNGFRVRLSLAMKTTLIHRLGVFWCLTTACIGLNAQNGEDRNYKVLSSFSEDFNGDKGDFSDLISLHGSARHQGKEARITSNRNGQNGAILLDDFSDF